MSIRWRHRLSAGESRPDFRSGNQDNIWPPMIEKPLDGLRRIERRKLMQRGRKPRRAKRAELRIADGQKHCKAKLPELFDKRHGAKRISAACHMQQGQPAAGPREIGPPEPLMPPQKIVAPDLPAPIKIEWPRRSEPRAC